MPENVLLDVPCESSTLYYSVYVFIIASGTQHLFMHLLLRIFFKGEIIAAPACHSPL